MEPGTLKLKVQAVKGVPFENKDVRLVIQCGESTSSTSIQESGNVITWSEELSLTVEFEGLENDMAALPSPLLVTVYGSNDVVIERYSQWLAMIPLGDSQEIHLRNSSKGVLVQLEVQLVRSMKEWLTPEVVVRPSLQGEVVFDPVKSTEGYEIVEGKLFKREYYRLPSQRNAKRIPSIMWLHELVDGLEDEQRSSLCQVVIKNDENTNQQTDEWAINFLKPFGEVCEHCNQYSLWMAFSSSLLRYQQTKWETEMILKTNQAKIEAVNESSKTIERYKARLKEKEEQIKSLTNQIEQFSSKTKRLENLEDENKQLRHEILVNKTLHNNDSIKSDYVKELEQQKDHLNEALQKKDEQIKELKELNNKLEINSLQLNHLTSERQRIQKLLDQSRDDYTKEMIAKSKQQKELMDQKKSIEIMNHDNTVLRKAKESLESELYKLKGELRKLRVDMAMNKSEINSQPPKMIKEEVEMHRKFQYSNNINSNNINNNLNPHPTKLPLPPTEPIKDTQTRAEAFTRTTALSDKSAIMNNGQKTRQEVEIVNYKRTSSPPRVPNIDVRRPSPIRAVPDKPIQLGTSNTSNLTVVDHNASSRRSRSMSPTRQLRGMASPPPKSRSISLGREIPLSPTSTFNMSPRKITVELRQATSPNSNQPTSPPLIRRVTLDKRPTSPSHKLVNIPTNSAPSAPQSNIKGRVASPTRSADAFNSPRLGPPTKYTAHDPRFNPIHQSQPDHSIPNPNPTQPIKPTNTTFSPPRATSTSSTVKTNQTHIQNSAATLVTEIKHSPFVTSPQRQPLIDRTNTNASTHTTNTSSISNLVNKLQRTPTSPTNGHSYHIRTLSPQHKTSTNTTTTKITSNTQNKSLTSSISIPISTTSTSTSTSSSSDLQIKYRTFSHTTGPAVSINASHYIHPAHIPQAPSTRRLSVTSTGPTNNNTNNNTNQTSLH